MTPFKSPETDNPLEILRYFKLINGLSFKRLRAIMRKDSEQLSGWFREKHAPCKRNMKYFIDFLKPYEKQDLFITPLRLKKN
jgi:hypothetical protein